MKLIMEGWRAYCATDVDEKTLIEEAGTFDTIRGLFKDDPFPGFDADATYEPGSYGTFAQSLIVSGQMTALKVQKTRENITKVVAAAFGASTGKEQSAVAKVTGPIVGTAMGLAGIVYSIPALTVAGLGAAVIAIAVAVEKDPSKAAKYPTLAFFNISAEYREMLDDKLEDVIEQKYSAHFMEKLLNAPNEPMLSLNDFLQQYIKDVHPETRGHTVTGHA